MTDDLHIKAIVILITVVIIALSFIVGGYNKDRQHRGVVESIEIRDVHGSCWRVEPGRRTGFMPIKCPS